MPAGWEVRERDRVASSLHDFSEAVSDASVGGGLGHAAGAAVPVRKGSRLLGCLIHRVLVCGRFAKRF